MSITKSGISIDCAHCHCIDNNDPGDFEVKVPLEDIDTGVAGIARLHCVISLNDHRVELTDWQDVDAQPIKAPEAMKQRLEQALAFIEEHRVCGNTKICPADVIRIVQTIEQK